MTRALRFGAMFAVLFTVGVGAHPAMAQGTGAQRTRSLDSRDALLAALGSATLECLGTVGPDQYDTRTGVLARTFDACTLRDGAALAQVDALLGVQLSAQGRRDSLAGHFVSRWNAFVESFPYKRSEVCPAWTLVNVLDAPTADSVRRSMSPLRAGKEGYRYAVSSRQCRNDGDCAVRHAWACAGGFGPEFLVDRDGRRSLVEVDPMWWLTRYTYPGTDANPFMTPGYYHAMSYYGDLPGALYGAIQRAGEACSEYLDGKHYTDRRLIPIDCGGGWMCMTYCMLPPPATIGP